MSNKDCRKHKRLRGSYQPLMRSRPGKAAHINRITSELAAVEGLLTFSGATGPDRVTQGCTICCGSRWVGEDHRLLPWNMTAAVRPVLRACAIGLKRSSGARFLPRCHLVPTSQRATFKLTSLPETGAVRAAEKSSRVNQDQAPPICFEERSIGPCFQLARSDEKRDRRACDAHARPPPGLESSSPLSLQTAEPHLTVLS
jgi:hypothetical protein